MSNRRVNLGCLAASLFVFIGVGCGEKTVVEEKFEVEGSVTMDSKPLTNATISFQDPDSGASDAAELDAGGKFKLSLPAGKYEVTFTPPAGKAPTGEGAMEAVEKETKNIPLGYQTGHTSGEVREIQSGTNTLKFELSKSGPAGAQ